MLVVSQAENIYHLGICVRKINNKTPKRRKRKPRDLLTDGNVSTEVASFWSEAVKWGSS